MHNRDLSVLTSAGASDILLKQTVGDCCINKQFRLELRSRFVCEPISLLASGSKRPLMDKVLQNVPVQRFIKDQFKCNECCLYVLEYLTDEPSCTFCCNYKNLLVPF